MTETTPFRTGYVAIVGRPNVGKSTLLNRLIGQKISITSRKPQTTRQRLTGILTLEHAQLLFVDTPGFQTQHGSALNSNMNRIVNRSLSEVSVVVLVVEALRFVDADRAVLKLIQPSQSVVLAINKVDKLADRSLLLPYIETMAALRPFAEIVPLSAATGVGVPELARTVAKYLPEHPAMYGPDEITEASERFLAAELIREKLFRLMGEELPYASAVRIESFVMEGEMRRIHACIIVDKQSHKGMVVGAKGSRIKAIGTQARLDMEKLFGGKVHLELWVKVSSGWSENQAMLNELGYG